MSVRRIVVVLAAILAMLAFTIRITSQSSEGIVVNGAAECKKVSVSIGQELMENASRVEARTVLQHTDQVRHIVMASVPTSLHLVFDPVSAHIVVQYANLIRQGNLTAMPSVLQTMLGQVSDRIVVQHADMSRQIALVYPAVLADEAAKPTTTAEHTPTQTPAHTPTVTVTRTPAETPSPTHTYSSVGSVVPTPEMTRSDLPVDLASTRNLWCLGALLLAIFISVIVVLFFVISHLVGSNIRSRKIATPARGKSKLLAVLSERFSQSELQRLCFELAIDYDDLPGTTKTDKARELIAYFERRDRMSDLIETGKRLRPDIPWDNAA